MLKIEHYKIMYTIRMVEKYILSYFEKGMISGTTHTCIGQEAIAVSALSLINEGDIVVSNHRSHGHFIAYSRNYKILINEIFGRNDGVCCGLGGSQHIQYSNFYSNGIVGGMVPIATGMAFAEKLINNNVITICFLGDGALGEGVIYEAFNMASLFSIPILYVVENNQYAQSTSIKTNLSGRIINRFNAFDINCHETGSNDIRDLLMHFKNAITYVRNQSKPFCEIVKTYRLGPHSKGDDYRKQFEINHHRRYDPIKIARNYFSKDDIKIIEENIENEIKKHFDSLKIRNENINSNDIKTDRNLIPSKGNENEFVKRIDRDIVLVKELNHIFKCLMDKYKKIYMIGEDISDPYGGAFKVTKGLSKKYPERIISTPISEAGIVGLSNGMALRGILPITEIMFGDFTTLIMDQIVNHATKFNRMYANHVRCPIIIRTPMGGYRGYGPTHSQSLESLFFSIPDLIITACDLINDQELIWNRMIKIKSPCLYIENKSIYGEKIKIQKNGMIEQFYVKNSPGYFPTSYLKITKFKENTDVAIITYGGMVQLAMNVAIELYVQEEIVALIVVPSQISPLPTDDILESIKYSSKIIVLEEGIERNGWGAEIGASLLERSIKNISFRRCSSKNTVIPNARDLEIEILPNERNCYNTILEMINEN